MARTSKSRHQWILNALIWELINNWSRKKGYNKADKLSFEVFNADRTKNGEVTKIAPLEIEINKHKEQLGAVITDLNRMDMFLGHDWLVKYNSEVN